MTPPPTPSSPPTPAEPVFVVFHEGCGDEPGPAPVPLSAGEEDAAWGEKIDAVAFTTREDAERALASTWPGGTVEKYLLVPAALLPALEREGGAS